MFSVFVASGFSLIPVRYTKRFKVGQREIQEFTKSSLTNIGALVFVVFLFFLRVMKS